MTRKTLKTVGIGLAAAGVLTGVAFVNPAVAYPPGTGMTISASASGPLATVLSVAVAQVKPFCNVTVTAVTSGGKTVSTTVKSNSSGAATAALTVPRTSRPITVTGTSVKCAAPETASTTTTAVRPYVYAPFSATVGTAFGVSAKNFPAKTTLTFIAKNKAGDMVKVTTTTNAAGYAAGSITLPSSGSWIIVAVAGGKSSSLSLKAS